MIEVSNLVKRYGDRNVVDDLSFTVEKGQIVGFLGPNGAGKSTTMNIITGYISATDGTVKVNGFDIVDEPENAKKSIGYLPEQPPLYPDMLVREYLKFVCDLKKVKKSDRDAEITKVMNKAKISDVSERLINHLSKGYKQRVGLAAAMIGEPEILILDEPTVGLDPKQIIEIRDLIKELSKKHTILLSSHIMQEVSAVCDQILIINQGKLVVADSTDAVSSHTKTNKIITVVVEGEKAAVKEALDMIDSDIEYKILHTETSGQFEVRINSDADDDIRKDISKNMAIKECIILEMNTKTPSLEDAFIELTGDGTKQYGGKKEKKKTNKEEK